MSQYTNELDNRNQTTSKR